MEEVKNLLPNARKRKKKRTGLYAKQINLELANRRLLTVLDRDIAFLMFASSQRMLEEAESKALIAYCKLVRDLRATEDSLPKDAPEDILARKVSTNSTPK